MEINKFAGMFLKEVVKRNKRGRFAYIIIKEHSLETIKECIRLAHLNPDKIIIKEGKISAKMVQNI